jgi:hypothetical protein
VKIWKDTADSDGGGAFVRTYQQQASSSAAAAAAAGVDSANRSSVRSSSLFSTDAHNSSELYGTGGVALASAFLALPDIAQISRGQSVSQSGSTMK